MGATAWMHYSPCSEHEDEFNDDTSSPLYISCSNSSICSRNSRSSDVSSIFLWSLLLLVQNNNSNIFVLMLFLLLLTEVTTIILASAPLFRTCLSVVKTNPARKSCPITLVVLPLSTPRIVSRSYHSNSWSRMVKSSSSSTRWLLERWNDDFASRSPRIVPMMHWYWSSRTSRFVIAVTLAGHDRSRPQPTKLVAGVTGPTIAAIAIEFVCFVGTISVALVSGSFSGCCLHMIFCCSCSWSSRNACCLLYHRNDRFLFLCPVSNKKFKVKFVRKSEIRSWFLLFPGLSRLNVRLERCIEAWKCLGIFPTKEVNFNTKMHELWLVLYQ